MIADFGCLMTGEILRTYCHMVYIIFKDAFTHLINTLYDIQLFVSCSSCTLYFLKGAYIKLLSLWVIIVSVRAVLGAGEIQVITF